MMNVHDSKTERIPNPNAGGCVPQREMPGGSWGISAAKFNTLLVFNNKVTKNEITQKIVRNSTEKNFGAWMRRGLHRILKSSSHLPPRSFLGGILLALLCFSESACVLSTMPYLPRKRNYKADDYASSAQTLEPGSLYASIHPGLFQDTRAARLGDIITIKVSESESAEQEANTNLSRDSKYSLGMPHLLGVTDKLKATSGSTVDLSKILETLAQSRFVGDGRTSRSGRLEGTLQARVKTILPNGDLYLEGHKIISVNGEDHHFYISGVIRQEDIATDNSVPSARIADAQVLYNGQGAVSEQQRQGWLHRFLNYATPF